MSISGTLSNYYVDSIINHESEDSPTKFPSGQFSAARQGSEHLEFPSCSFQPKPAVFGAPWASPVHAARRLRKKKKKKKKQNRRGCLEVN
uniref:Hox9 N-terminal activation domain-containing protein n=1 Tax=Catharus ustulatus TaxID=91951 RepID=A0A8C3Y4X0_CATUS